jgi:hypothetical protein
MVDSFELEEIKGRIENLKDYVLNQQQIVLKSFDKINKKDLMQSYVAIHDELQNIYEEMEMWQ